MLKNLSLCDLDKGSITVKVKIEGEKRIYIIYIIPAKRSYPMSNYSSVVVVLRDIKGCNLKKFSCAGPSGGNVGRGNNPAQFCDPVVLVVIEIRVVVSSFGGWRAPFGGVCVASVGLFV